MTEKTDENSPKDEDRPTNIDISKCAKLFFYRYLLFSLLAHHVHSFSGNYLHLITFLALPSQEPSAHSLQPFTHVRTKPMQSYSFFLTFRYYFPTFLYLPQSISSFLSSLSIDSTKMSRARCCSSEGSSSQRRALADSITSLRATSSIKEAL